MLPQLRSHVHTHRLNRLTVLHKQRIVLVMFGSNSIRKQEARSLVAIVARAAAPFALFGHSGFKKMLFLLSLCRYFAQTLWLMCMFTWKLQKATLRIVVTRVRKKKNTSEASRSASIVFMNGVSLSVVWKFSIISSCKAARVATLDWTLVLQFIWILYYFIKHICCM